MPAGSHPANRSSRLVRSLRGLVRSLPRDFELLRLILLHLEDRQTSPRATVIIELAAEAEAVACDAGSLEDGLNLLLQLGYIEGPGAEANGFWLFRKLSRKGAEFVRLARDPADWSRLKHRRREESDQP